MVHMYVSATNNHHGIVMPLSASHIDPVLSRFSCSVSLIIRSALCCGVKVPTPRFSMGVFLASCKVLYISVLTCKLVHIETLKLEAGEYTKCVTCYAGTQDHVAWSKDLTTPGCISPTGIPLCLKSLARVTPAMCRAALPIRYPYCKQFCLWKLCMLNFI